MLNLKKIYILLFCIPLIGCNTLSNQYEKNSGITHGTVQLHLTKGETTQADVLEKFGSPNIATTDSQGEIWTYQKHGVTAKASGVAGSLFLVAGSTSGFTQNSRNMTLIIKFDSKNIVRDFSSRYSSF